MNFKCCDVCEIVIKNKAVPPPAPTKLIPVKMTATEQMEQMMREMQTNFFMASKEARPSDAYVCNKELCEKCKLSFLIACKAWEGARRKETEGLRWSNG